MPDNPFRRLPSVARVLAAAPLADSPAAHAERVAAVRAELADLRDAVRRGRDPDTSPEAVAARAAGRLASAPRLRTVINATGVVLHTNLGRAPLAEAAARAAADAARGYVNLELDLAAGKRAGRLDAARPPLLAATGAEAAVVVNNCAAATVLALRALAAGREVVVSRGQLVEIGGGFRLPEVMAASGARLREVGTTNVTRLADYDAAVGPDTGLILRVHASNYRVRGFTRSVPLADLVALGRRRGVPVVDDLGSGALIDLTPFGLPGEPVARASLAAGADLVLFSGDKLLGGPQAGIAAGRRDLVRRLERDPLMRAVRPDKMTLAALAATLRLYADPARAVREVPALRMLTLTAAELRPRAERLAAALAGAPGLGRVAVRGDESFAGGGSLPEVPLPTFVAAVRPDGLSAAELARRLRTGEPAVLARVRRDEVRLDPRSVFEHQDDALAAAVRAACPS